MSNLPNLVVDAGGAIGVIMQSPSISTASMTTGGTLPSHAYTLAITALDGQGGETVAGPLYTVLPSALNNTLSYTMTGVEGAVANNVYLCYGADPDPSAPVWHLIGTWYTYNGASHTLTTLAGIADPVVLPAANTAYVTKLVSSGRSTLLSGNLLVGGTDFGYLQLGDANLSQNATINFSDLGQNSLTISTNYDSATNEIVFAPGATTLVTLSRAGGMVVSGAITSSGNIVSGDDVTVNGNLNLIHDVNNVSGTNLVVTLVNGPSRTPYTGGSYIVTLAKVTSGGADGSLTTLNGIVVSYVAPT